MPKLPRQRADQLVFEQGLAESREQALRSAWQSVITALHQADPDLFADPTRTAADAAVDSIWRVAAVASSQAKGGATP